MEKKMKKTICGKKNSEHSIFYEDEFQRFVVKKKNTDE